MPGRKNATNRRRASPSSSRNQRASASNRKPTTGNRAEKPKRAPPTKKQEGPAKKWENDRDVSKIVALRAAGWSHQIIGEYLRPVRTSQAVRLKFFHTAIEAREDFLVGMSEDELVLLKRDLWAKSEDARADARFEERWAGAFEKRRAIVRVRDTADILLGMAIAANQPMPDPLALPAAAPLALPAPAPRAYATPAQRRLWWDTVMQPPSLNSSSAFSSATTTWSSSLPLRSSFSSAPAGTTTLPHPLGAVAGSVATAPARLQQPVDGTDQGLFRPVNAAGSSHR